MGCLDITLTPSASYIDEYYEVTSALLAIAGMLHQSRELFLEVTLVQSPLEDSKIVAVLWVVGDSALFRARTELCFEVARK